MQKLTFSKFCIDINQLCQGKQKWLVHTGQPLKATGKIAPGDIVGGLVVCTAIVIVNHFADGTDTAATFRQSPFPSLFFNVRAIKTISKVFIKP